MPKTKTKVSKDSLKKAEKSPSKKPSKKPSARVKKTSSVTPTVSKSSSNTFTRTRLSHFVKDMLPQSFSKKSFISSANEDVITAIFAVIIACIVIMLGFLYAYSQTAPVSTILPKTQKAQISSSVKLTPEVLTALGDIFSQAQIDSSEVLVHIFSGYDAWLPPDISEYFGESLKWGDMIFQFSHRVVLYRPSEKSIVKTRIDSL